jgi:hypothetical protein
MLKQCVHNLRLAWALRRWRRALLVAALSDGLGFGAALLPPAQWVLDAVTAAALFAVLGFRWSLLSALFVEAVPGLAMFPTWTLVVAALATAEIPGDRAGPQVVEEDARSSS